MWNAVFPRGNGRRVEDRRLTFYASNRGVEDNLSILYARVFAENIQHLTSHCELTVTQFIETSKTKAAPTRNAAP